MQARFARALAIVSAASSFALLAGCSDGETTTSTTTSTSTTATATSSSSGTGGAGGGTGDTGGGGGTGGAPDVLPPAGSVAAFAVLETTDIHTNVRSYDYFKLAEDKSLGIERTSTLINQARQEIPNNILVDNGDTIQGTVLADYQATVQPVSCAASLAVYKAMNTMGVDVGGIGNHEFNYGLKFLSQVTHTPFDVEGVDTSGAAGCQGPAFPLVSSNVFSLKSGKTLFQPSVIVTKTISATTMDGKTVSGKIKVGFLGFTPPPILNWDKASLEGKVFTKGVQEVAAPLIQDLRAKGADLVVAIIHGGLDNTAYTPGLESQAWYLAQVPGIDAMLMGHSHQVFPDAKSTSPQFNLPLVAKDEGEVAGVPAVMANFWGQHLGVIKMGLTFDGARWTVDKKATVVEARPIATTCNGGLPAACDAMGKWRTGATCSFATLCAGLADKTKVYVDVDPAIAPLIEAEHQGTIAYVKTPLGTTDFEMSTFFTEEGDVGAIEIVNQAQTAYVTSYIQQNLPQYASLPVLSMSAPFKTGFQGGNDYTDVQSGAVAINNAADLYLYANTLYAVKVTGAQIIDWLETAATRFLQIDPTNPAPQPLINQGMPGYNFDMFTDPRISYDIDVTKPLPPMGMKASGRIKNVLFNGAPLDLTAEFIVATNNYRASGGGSFPGLDGTKTIYASPDTSRDVLIAYIKKNPTITRAANGSDRSFHFTKTTTAGPVTFTSAQNVLPKALAAGITNVSLVQQDDGSGKMLSLYALDLSK